MAGDDTTPIYSQIAASEESPVANDDETQALKDRIAALEAAQAAGVVPPHNVPEHAGGPGLEIAPTWSQAEQEAARAEVG